MGPNPGKTSAEECQLSPVICNLLPVTSHRFACHHSNVILPKGAGHKLPIDTAPDANQNYTCTFGVKALGSFPHSAYGQLSLVLCFGPAKFSLLWPLSDPGTGGDLNSIGSHG